MATDTLARFADSEEAKRKAGDGDFSMFDGVTSARVASWFENVRSDEDGAFTIDGRSVFDSVAVTRRWTGIDARAHVVAASCIDRSAWIWNYSDGRTGEAAHKRTRWIVTFTADDGAGWLITSIRATDQPGC